MRRAWFAVLLTTLAVGAVGSAGVEAQRRQRQPQAQQPGPDQAARDRARDAYARGQEAFRTGDYDEAVAGFQAAYEAVPNPVVLLGLAEAQERQGDIAGTVATLERYLAERPDAPDAAQVRERIGELQARPATLVITSDPPGAAIAIDGEPREEVTPAEIEVPAGEYAVALTLPDHDPASETVQAAPGGRHELEVDMQVAVTVTDEDDVFGAGDGGAAPAEAPDLQDDEEQGLSAGVWVAAGVSGAALVGGTVLGFLALSEQSDFDMMPTEDSADRGERLALFADVAFGVAAIAGVTAVVLYLTDGREAEDDAPDVASVEVTPVVSPEGGGMTAQVRF